MAGVTIETGEFPLIRNIDHTRQPERMRVLTEWSKAFHYSVPDAVEHLADVIEDVYAFELWKEDRLDTPEQFFERMGLFDLDLENPAKLIKELRKKRSKLKTKLIARGEEAARLREQGMPETQIAAQQKRHRTTVWRDKKALQKQSHDTKPATRRKVTVYQINQGTKPETAARKLREKFGAEWCRKLGKELSNAT